MRKLIILAITVFFAFSSAGICFAGAKANARKGKYTYRKVYKSCHKRGEVESATPLLSPDTKTMAQWDKVFDKVINNKDENKPATELVDDDFFEQFKCKEEWSKLTGKDMINVHAYLRAHAADSPSPAKCK
ncbi:MAG: cytochrome c family protein [Deltaproteobacteria bacterium]|nr:MAG: cytochrome c family protein [Deltaproteobacteria bacterium]RUA00313.1 MAG: cytochrome c family protein [Deltaproteobacteria bacterium]